VAWYGLLTLQNEQVKVIDAARMSVKRRKGVAFFIKHFPVSRNSARARVVGCNEVDTC
jgi:hypothetical protein